MEKSFKYDAFISYAVEDKGGFVNALVKALEDRGLNVYYSSKYFKLGDAIHQEISLAIKNSKFGVPILSEDYLESGWTQFELGGFIARYTSGMMKILPIWHGLDHDKMTDTHPTISGIWSVDSKLGVEQVADKISGAILHSDNSPKGGINPPKVASRRKKRLWKNPFSILVASLIVIANIGFFLPAMKNNNTPQPFVNISDSASYYFNKGEKAFNYNNYGEAMALYSTALRFHKKPEYLVKRGKCYFLLNNTENAVKDFNEVIKSHPNHDLAYYERAKCYVYLNQIPFAVKDLKEAMRLKHPQADSLYDIVNPTLKKKVGKISICCDGTRSEKTGQGACSHHDGVCDEKDIYKEYRKY